MQELRDFVQTHAERGTCRCGKCLDTTGVDQQPADHTIDMVFFEVAVKGEPDPAEMLRLVKESRNGEFCEMDPFDGEEHSYIEVGGWIGDQGLALMFMGLGKLLGLWSVMTPKMLPGLPDDMVQMMAGSGMITIMPPKSTAAVSV